MRNYWILRSNTCKLPSSLANPITWDITHDWEAIQVGDGVVLWQTDKPAGIYALGKIQQCFSQTQQIAVGYTQILPHLLLQELLRNHPILQSLAVMETLPITLNCSNFSLEAEAWQALQRLVEQSFTLPALNPEISQTPIISNYAAPSFVQIAERILAQALRYSTDILRRYHLSLQSRQFVILSGISGTGKTALAENYARAVQAEYLLVPVAPNWMSNEDLLGYYNPMTQSYQDTECSRFLRHATQEYQVNPDNPRPYHLILDEMNLARVEYYFARFLSLLETRHRGQAAQLEFMSGDSIILPNNLYVIGTVNMDETTHGFADKVYDRAQYLELSIELEQIAEHLGNLAYAELMLEVWRLLQPVAPFGFRVLDDIQAYVKSAEALDIQWHIAIDEQIVQKLLPKLRGTNAYLEKALLGLLACAKQYDLPHTQQKAQALYAEVSQHGIRL